MCVEWGWRGKGREEDGKGERGGREGHLPGGLSESSASMSFLLQCNLIFGKQSSFVSPFPARTATGPRREERQKGAGGKSRQVGEIAGHLRDQGFAKLSCPFPSLSAPIARPLAGGHTALRLCLGSSCPQWVIPSAFSPLGLQHWIISLLTHSFLHPPFPRDGTMYLYSIRRDDLGRRNKTTDEPTPLPAPQLDGFFIVCLGSHNGV